MLSIEAFDTANPVLIVSGERIEGLGSVLAIRDVLRDSGVSDDEEVRIHYPGGLSMTQEVGAL